MSHVHHHVIMSHTDLMPRVAMLQPSISCRYAGTPGSSPNYGTPGSSPGYGTPGSSPYGTPSSSPPYGTPGSSPAYDPLANPSGAAKQPTKVNLPKLDVDINALVNWNFLLQLFLAGVSWAVIFFTSHTQLAKVQHSHQWHESCVNHVTCFTVH